MILKRKTRSLAIRLTEEQYLSLRQLSVIRGARSVSDYARDSLCGAFARMAPAPDEGIESQLATLSKDLATIAHELQKVKSSMNQAAEAKA
jgi:hypothetical protein